MKRSNLNILIVVFLIIIGAIARIVNAQLHVPNVAPMVALSLFSGAFLKDKRGLAFIAPFLGQFLADAYFQMFTDIPGFYSWVGMPFNYAGLLCAALIGSFMKMKPVNVLAYTIGASSAFFLISNFGYFMEGWNGYSFAGLSKTFIDAVPFFKNTLMGDMMGSLLMFGGYFLVQMGLEKKAQKVKA